MVATLLLAAGALFDAQPASAGASFALEFCRKSGHEATGGAGNGEAIVCTDNNGWRWEPIHAAR